MDNFRGIWKLRNGFFAQILHHRWNIGWRGIIFNEKGQQVYREFYWNNEGNDLGNPEFDLMERKRGEEDGWPKLGIQGN